MYLDFFQKLHPFIAALVMHKHLARCPCIDTNRLIAPSLVYVYAIYVYLYTYVLYICISVHN